MTRNLLSAKYKFILRKQHKLVLSVFSLWLRQGRKTLRGENGGRPEHIACVSVPVRSTEASHVAHQARNVLTQPKPDHTDSEVCLWI